MTKDIWREALLSPNASIQEAIHNLDRVAIKIALVINDTGELVGTISDGDIRRGLLRGLTLDSSIAGIIHRDALVVPNGMARKTVVDLMIANKLQQIPVVDDQRCVIGLHLWDEISVPQPRNNLMIIMAGGKGTRLRPYTETCPKPLLFVAGKPILEHIINRAKQEGFTSFVLAIHYLGGQIEEYFGDGNSLNVNIEYLREEKPMGTAGALALLHSLPTEPFVVTNGDVLTDIRYGELIDFHTRHAASATMAVRLHEWQHPYGVVQTKGIEIIGFEEKPVARTHINAGVYVLSPDVLKELDVDSPCDMPTLFERLQLQSMRTIAYPMHEPWLDVGKPEDLAVAQLNCK